MVGSNADDIGSVGDPLVIDCRDAARMIWSIRAHGDVTLLDDGIRGITELIIARLVFKVTVTLDLSLRSTSQSFNAREFFIRPG
jgi:hypothetical protein